MKRGEIYWADLAPRSGSKQTGRRPVIVLAHDGFNQAPGWQSVIVVPMSTSKAQARRGPTAVQVPRSASGLSRDGVALCHQVTTLDRAKLSRFVASLTPGILMSVAEGLKAALDLD